MALNKNESFCVFPWNKLKFAFIIGAPIAVAIGFWYTKQKISRRGQDKNQRDENGEDQNLRKEVISNGEGADNTHHNAEIQMSPHEQEMSTNERERLAGLKMESGNQLYVLERYEEAVPFYTEAIKLFPDSSEYYVSRSTCYMMLHQYEDCLDDARESVALNNCYVKGYIQIAICSLTLGDLSAADNAISVVENLSPNNPDIIPVVQKLEAIRRLNEEKNKAYHEKDVRKVVLCLDEMIKEVPYTAFEVQKAEFLASIGHYQEAREIANDILQIGKRIADAIYIYGMTSYYQENLEQASNFLKFVLKSIPRHQRANSMYRSINDLIRGKAEGKPQHEDCFHILGVDKSASTSEIKHAYRKRALLHHPDRHANASQDEIQKHEALFKDAGEAYEILSNRQEKE